MVITILFIEGVLTSRLTKANFLKIQTFFISLIMSLPEKFLAAVKVIQSLPKDGPYQPATHTKLRFYSLYKQATEGPCNIPKPAFYDIIGRTKWDAWMKLGEMCKEDAMNAYIDELKNIVETMSFNGDVQDFLDSIGPFYEFVTLHGEEMSDIKEAIERVTSSSSSSSPTPTMSTDSSPQDTPLNGIISRPNCNGAATIPNGYLPNHVREEIESVSAKYYPPSAPVHRRSIPHCSRDAQESGFYENGEISDEVLEIEEANIEHSNSKLPTKLSQETTGTDSDKYYSGDSEPEFEEKISPIVSSTIQSTSRQNRRTHDSVLNFQSSPVNQSTELVLQNTVERLNRDVDHILARLRILETAYSTNPNGNNQTIRRRRLFGDVSRPTLTLIFSWPFVAYFIIKLISWWFARKRRTNMRQITG